MKSEQLILALDVPTAQEALSWIERLGPRIGYYKVGLQLFSTGGPELVRNLRSHGVNIFLDLKLHDIPNTVAKAVDAILDLDVQLLTIHASGGQAMCKAAVHAAQGSDLKLLGVTVLTSLDEIDVAEIGFKETPPKLVPRLAQLATKVGVHGIVCSAIEVAHLKQQVPEGTLLVTPGIRPVDSETGDQSRIATPESALASGSTHLVIGRPILQAENPEAVLDTLLT
ncbi:MAG: orotidine-5'-phosphate decarboxylase [Verrucomicrobiota bacterium]